MLYYQYFQTPIGLLQAVADFKVLKKLYRVDVDTQVKQSGDAFEHDLLCRLGVELELYFVGNLDRFSVEYLLEGTSFQQKVWSALTEIEYGKTVSYRDIALKIKHVRAVRAVGNACGKNPLLIIIPCHRVITSTGFLGGYVAGAAYKKLLLKYESLLI